MPVNIIERAKQKKADAERRLQQLQEDMERAKREAVEWDSFIEKAEALASGLPLGESQPVATLRDQPAENGVRVAKVMVQKESWAGWSARILLVKGPMSLRSIAEELIDKRSGVEVRDFIANLNSALWRRKDLFERKDGRYHLLTRDIEFVDDPTASRK